MLIGVSRWLKEERETNKINLKRGYTWTPDITLL